MTATKFNNRLMTAELREALSDYPLYSQDAKGKDALCIAVFHLGNIRWYIMEGQPEGDDFTLYGIVVGLQETEYGYMSATEMADVTYDNQLLTHTKIPEYIPQNLIIRYLSTHNLCQMEQTFP